MTVAWAFDIETTGLIPKETTGILPENIPSHTLLGIASIHGIHQFCCPTREDEKTSLMRLNSFVDDHFDAVKDYCITYNGRNFDFPFSRMRSEFLNGLTTPKELRNRHVDLFEYCKQMNGGVRISKDQFCSKYLDMYVPRMCSGAYMATAYSKKEIWVSREQLCIQNMQHNAIDLVTTLEMFRRLSFFPDFQDYIDSQLKINKE